jgi:hypothetical protein
MFRARNAASSSHKARDSNASTDGLLGETSGSTSGISLNTNLNTGNTSRFRSSSASSPASSSREVYYLQVPIPGFLVKLYRTATSRSATWKQALPQIAFLSSAALLIWTFVWAIHYIKVSRIYVPAYRTIPLVTEAQTQAASVRHLTHDQCMASFPGLYEYVHLPYPVANSARPQQATDACRLPLHYPVRRTASWITGCEEAVCR